MKKIIGLIFVCVVLSVGVIFLFKREVVTELAFSNPVEANQMSHEQVQIKGKVNSRTVLLKNLDTNEVILEKNTDKKVAIASLTKLMTVYLLIQQTDNLADPVSISQRTLDDLVVEGASLSGYLAEDTLTIQDLAYGVVLASGGDAAVTAAEYVSGSESAFVALMNQTAESMGMNDTHFMNPTGLDEKDHYSTVKDLMIFMDVALKNTVFTTILTTTQYESSPTPYAPEGYYLESTLLKDSADLSLTNGQILGGKTGYTEKAGQCLISLAEVKGQRYLLITTGANGNALTEQLSVVDARNIFQSI